MRAVAGCCAAVVVGVPVLAPAEPDRRSHASAAAGCAPTTQIVSSSRFELPREIRGQAVDPASARNQRPTVFDVHSELLELVCFGDAARTAKALEGTRFEPTWKMLENGRTVERPPSGTRVVSVQNARGETWGVPRDTRLIIEIGPSDAGVTAGH